MNNTHPLVANRMAFLVIGCLETAWTSSDRKRCKVPSTKVLYDKGRGFYMLINFAATY